MLNRPAADRGVSTLFISVIIPVRNESRFIEQTLTELVDQDYAPDRFEILVVDGQSTDGTPDLVARFTAGHPNVRLFDNPRRLSSAARNIAIRHAGHRVPAVDDVVVLVDGHCELADRRYLQKLAAAFERSGADCLGRPQPQDYFSPLPPGEGPGVRATAFSPLPPGEGQGVRASANLTTLQRAIAAARSSRLGHHPDSFIYSSDEQFVPAESVAAAYRRSVFEKVGYFDENFDACEDVEFNHRVDRAGLKCYFTPEVAVHYAPRDTLRGLYRQLFRYGRGRVRLVRKHPETFSLLPMVPGLFVAGVLLGPLAALAWAPLAVVYFAVLLLYATILLAGSIAIARHAHDYRLIPWLPLVFATVHAGSGTGLLWELLRPARAAVSDSTPGGLSTASG
jgi:succinoglycan biosynthesis protein ExoA